MPIPLCAPQHASQCLAAERGCSTVHGITVHASAACSRSTRRSPPFLGAADVDAAAAAAIVLTLGFNRSDVRPAFRRDPFASYRDTSLLVLRCVLSLRRVETKLPVKLLVAGERDERTERVIARQNVGILATPTDLHAPKWSSPFMRGTFHKLGALALTQYKRIILLDADTIAVRNIDHMARAPGPLAGYFHFDLGYTCPQPWASMNCMSGVLNSGVLVLEPSLTRLRKAQRLLAATDYFASFGSEGIWETSDQRVWHALYDRAHELPFGYNANADANLTRQQWEEVSVLHDIIVQRKRGWARSGFKGVVDELTRRAKIELAR